MSCPEFWEKKHSVKDKYWLTDSNPQQVLKMHGVLPEFEKCKTFLDVGVGFGGMTKYVKGKKKHVTSTDISQTALDNLKDVSDKTILITEVSSIEPVDLAVCHLVFQHCNDETITAIMNDVPIKDNTGVLSVQFACIRPGDKPNPNVQKLLKNGTHYLRSLDEFKTLVSNGTNKEVVFVSPPTDYKKTENLRWYFCKLKNKKLKT